MRGFNKMDLANDKMFLKSFKEYYNIKEAELITNYINDYLEGFDLTRLGSVINIIKTSIVLGMTYTECLEKVVELEGKRIDGEEDLEVLVVSLLLKIALENDSINLGNIVKKKRNFLTEVIADKLNIGLNDVTDDHVNRFYERQTKFLESGELNIEVENQSWDKYFFNVCKEVAKNSKCLSRQIGSILVKDNSIISTGYNGPPRGVPVCDRRWDLDEEFRRRYYRDGMKTSGICPRRVIGFKSGEGLDACVAGHSERNSLINAARNGICTKGTKMFMTCNIPCSPCLVEIINAGVEELIVTNTTAYDNSAYYLINNSNVKVRLFDFI